MRITDLIVDQPEGLLRIATDAGHEGWCTDLPDDAGGQILIRFASALMDQNPIDRERLWHVLVDIDRLYASGLRGYVDVALWDLAAKHAGLPLYQYISGFRNRIPAYNRGVEELDGEPVVHEAMRAQKDGFPGYKITCELSVERLQWLIPEIRHWVGADFYLLFEADRPLTIRDAIAVGRSLDASDGYLFECPRPDGDFTGSKQVADEVDVSVSMRVSTPMEAAQVFALQAADAIRTGTSAGVGITDVLKMARCAEAFGAHIHLSGAGLSSGFAHAHLLGAIKNAPFFEAEDTGPVPCGAIIGNPLRVEEGYLLLPDGPGLGMALM